MSRLRAERRTKLSDGNHISPLPIPQSAGSRPSGSRVHRGRLRDCRRRLRRSSTEGPIRMTPAADSIKEIVKQLDQELAKLRPMVEEYERLQAARAVLDR